jgi:tetratricopeptide (TPR) repeat protein
MSETSPSPETAESAGDDRFKRFVAFLITSMIIIAAVVSVLQTRAGALAAQYGREAQSYSIRAMGLKTSGQAAVSYGWESAYQNWAELNDLWDRADRASLAAEAARYKTARDRIVQLSPLLAAPYFDPSADRQPNLDKYEADVYWVAATALSEHYTDSAKQNEGWDGKARAHTTHLTLLAVALSLYGLATTITGRWVRWLFVAAGTLITAFNLVWILIVALLPVSHLPTASIDAYAAGVGLARQRGSDNKQAAIDKFTEALADAPGYANALYERGNAYFDLAGSALAAGDVISATPHYEAAVADYEAAQKAGRDDTNVGWNLGWTYYLLGRHDDAIRMDRHVLDMDPNLVGVRTNLGIALLVTGRVDEAKAEYQTAMDTAARLVADAKAAGKEPPASLWWYLDAGAIDIENLLDRMDGKVYQWTQAPGPETITDAEAVRAAAPEIVKQLRELTTSLEYTSQPPQSEASATVSKVEFGLERYDQAGNFVDYDVSDTFPYGTDRLLMLFNYAGMRDGQKVIWKVYEGGSELTDLRRVSDWSLGESGGAEKPFSYAYSDYFIFSAGEYEVDMFVDYRLVAQGKFTIRETKGATPLKTSGASGDVLFQDDFSNPFSGWSRLTESDYTIDYADGHYRFDIAKDNILVTGRPQLDFSDVSVEVDGAKASGPDSVYGVICRYQDGDNYYVLEMTDTGSSAIYKLKGGQWQALAEFGQSAAIQTGTATNHLRADCVGETLTLYVNGQKVAEAQDSDFASGDVALMAGSYDNPGVEVLFDNFVVRQP